MKKFFIGLITGLLISISTFAFANSQTIKLFVDDKEIKPDVPPQIIGGRVLVPARYVAEALGASVYWDEKTGIVFIASNIHKTPQKPTTPDYYNMSINELYKALDEKSKLEKIINTEKGGYIKIYSIKDSNYWYVLDKQAKEAYLIKKINEMKKEFPNMQVIYSYGIADDKDVLGDINYTPIDDKTRIKVK